MKPLKSIITTWSILYADEILQGLDRELGTAEGVGGVDLVLAVARDLDIHVARERDDVGLGALR